MGRVAALTYAAHGATVILHGRKVEKLESVYDEIEAAGGGLVEADTLAGTGLLLQRWCSLPDQAKQVMGERARAAFYRHFTIGQAAEKMVTVLKTNMLGGGLI